MKDSISKIAGIVKLAYFNVLFFMRGILRQLWMPYLARPSTLKEMRNTYNWNHNYECMFDKNKHLINISQPRHGCYLAISPYFEKQARTGFKLLPIFQHPGER